MYEQTRTRGRGSSWFALAGGLALAVALCAPAAFGPQSALAAVVWDGDTSSNFETPGNWVGGIAPANDTTGDVAQFNTGTTYQPSLIQSRSILGLDFLSAGWTLGGDYTLTVGANGIDSAGAGTNTISTTGVALGAASNWTVGPGNTLSVGSLVSGSNALIKDGAGTLTLGGDNSYNGTTTVSDGVLKITHPNALGDTAAGTSVPSGTSWLEVSGGNNVAEPISIGWCSTLGTLRSVAGDNTWSGPITITNSAWITVRSANTFALTGGITATGGGSLYLGGVSGGTITISGQPINIGTRTFGTADRATVNLNVGDNTWGGTHVYRSTLKLGLDNAIPTTSIVTLGYTSEDPIYLGYAGGTLDLFDHDQMIGGLTHGNTQSAERRVVNSGSGTPTLTINNSADYTFNGILGKAGQDSFNLVKTGSGTFTLSGDNSYNGTTTVSDGVLKITHPNALGDTAAGTSVPSVPTVTSWLEVSGGITVAEPISIGWCGSTLGALRSVGDNTWSGPITLTDSAWIGVRSANIFALTGGITATGGSRLSLGGSSNGTITISGQPINIGTRTFVTADLTTVVLNIDNNTWGDTHIYRSTLKLGLDNAIPTTSVVTLGHSAGGVFAGGTLDLFGHDQMIAGLTQQTTATTAERRVVNSGSGTPTLTVNNSADYTFNGILGKAGQDSFNLVKTGSGTFTLSGDSSYSGTTTVSGGVLRVTHPNALGDTAVGTTVANGNRLEVSGGINVAEPISITGTGSWRGALRSAGGNNTWSGPITITGSAGIGVGTTDTFALTGGITGGSLFFGGYGNGTITVSGQPINVGANTLTVGNDTTVVLNIGGNTWRGTQIYSGTLKLGGDDAMPVATVVTLGHSAGGVYAGGTLDLFGHNQTIAGLTHATTDTDRERRVVNSGSGTPTLTVNNSADYTFDGILGKAAQNSLNLVKQGTGIWTLTGNNTYTGDTDVQAGTLALSHDTSNNNISGSPLVRVGAGATLDVTGLADPADLILASGQTLIGNGTVLGNLSVAVGSTISAGDSPGHIIIDGIYTQSGTMLAELGGTAQGATTNGYDWIDVSGTATLGGTVDVDFFGGFTPVIGNSFDILTADGGITNADLSAVTFDFSDAPFVGNWLKEIVSLDGGGEALRLSVVPEPGSIVLLVLGCIALLPLGRRRRK